MGLAQAPAVPALLRPGGQLSREFTKTPASLLPPPPLRSSLLGVGVLTLFGAHHLVRVMSGRKSSLSGPPRSGRLQGRAFGRGSERNREGAEGG